MTDRKSGDLRGPRRIGGRRHRGIVFAPAISALAAALAFIPTFASAADVGELEEIMVTAQKREQRLQDVGISISALRAEDVERLGIRDTTDIVSVVPSLQFNRFSPAYTVFNVRGVSQNDYGDQQEPPIAVYQDDSYASTLNLGGFPVFDLESIQVLRGPQGTLFGRNATGGLIQYLTKKPTKEFEAYVRPTAGRFKEFDIEGAVSGPLGQSVQGRLAFQRSKNEGYFRNIFGGHNGKLAAQPTENVSGLFTVRYARNMKESTGGNYSWQLAYPGEHGLGEFAGPNDPSPFGTCDGCDLGGYKNPALNPQWGGDPWKLAFTDSADFDRTLRGASFKLDVDAGAVDLVSVTDYIGMSKTYNEDSDASPNAVWKYRAENNLKQFSQELRAGGETGKNTWVVGAFYMHVNGHYQASLPFPIFDYTRPTGSGRQHRRGHCLRRTSSKSTITGLSSRVDELGGISGKSISTSRTISGWWSTTTRLFIRVSPIRPSRIFRVSWRLITSSATAPWPI
jgi:iron complex outermembrane receptor protein